MIRRNAAALAISASVAIAFPAAAEPGVETISAEDLAARLAAGEVVLIDVRTPAEFADVRIAPALNAPLSHFSAAAIPLEAERETIFYCRSSRRSEIAAQKFAERTGETVRHLEGGIIAWETAGQPTVSDQPDDAD